LAGAIGQGKGRKIRIVGESETSVVARGEVVAE
jgi:hypothetical protein